VKNFFGGACDHSLTWLSGEEIMAINNVEVPTRNVHYYVAGADYQRIKKSHSERKLLRYLLQRKTGHTSVNGFVYLRDQWDEFSPEKKQQELSRDCGEHRNVFVEISYQQTAIQRFIGKGEDLSGSKTKLGWRT
jgi:hypothetical protein